MINDTVLKGRFKILHKVGQGAFGEIYVALDLKTNENVAVKFEKGDSKRNVLRAEVNILRKLQGCGFFCRYFQCGTERIQDADFNFLVMELLGDNISDIRKRQPDNKFGLQTTARLGAQMLHCIEEIHECGYLHRDIKPSNFAMGLGSEKQYRCYMIDFGLARRYLMPTGETRPARDNAGFRGTARYASVNSHLCKELGRRDDLWSLLYVLIEFLLGHLPWRKCKDKDAIGRVKAEQTGSPHFLAQIPEELRMFHKHVASLGFADRPNYAMLHSLLHKMFLRAGPPPLSPYDWFQPSLQPGIAMTPALKRDQSKPRNPVHVGSKGSKAKKSGEADVPNEGTEIQRSLEGEDSGQGPGTPRKKQTGGSGEDSGPRGAAGADDAAQALSVSAMDLFAPPHICRGATFSVAAIVAGQSTTGALASAGSVSTPVTSRGNTGDRERAKESNSGGKARGSLVDHNAKASTPDANGHAADGDGKQRDDLLADVEVDVIDGLEKDLLRPNHHDSGDPAAGGPETPKRTPSKVASSRRDGDTGATRRKRQQAVSARGRRTVTLKSQKIGRNAQIGKRSVLNRHCIVS